MNIKAGGLPDQGEVNLIFGKKKGKKCGGFCGTSPYLKLVSLWETLVNFCCSGKVKIRMKH